MGYVAGKARYFATAVKLGVIDEYETIFEMLGWQAGLILPRAVSEAGWLFDKNNKSDSLLISAQPDGFVALILRGDEPTVVRSVTCTETERDDEIYRLLMFYRDRLGDDKSNILARVMDFVVRKRGAFFVANALAERVFIRTADIL